MDAVAAGVSRRAAANGAGISYATLKDWAARGRDGEALYSAFLAKLEAAEAGAEREMVDCLFLAAKEGKHDAAKFWLTVRRSADYAAKVAADADAEASAEAGAVDDSVIESIYAAMKSRRAG